MTARKKIVMKKLMVVSIHDIDILLFCILHLNADCEGRRGRKAVYYSAVLRKELVTYCILLRTTANVLCMTERLAIREGRGDGICI